jgi:hypothetical protein
VRSFTLQFDAGPDSPLVLTRDLCNPRTNIAIEATLVSHSGKRVQARQQPATPGCDPRAAVSIRRRGRRAKLVARLSAAREGPDMTAASLALPRPLRRGSRGPLVYIGKRRLVPRSGLRNASIALPGPARSAVVVWRGLRAGPKLRRLTRVVVKITDSRGQTTRLRPTVRVRGRRPPA